MKKFENPEIKIEEMNIFDVITTSGNGCDVHNDCSDDLPIN